MKVNLNSSEALASFLRQMATAVGQCRPWLGVVCYVDGDDGSDVVRMSRTTSYFPVGLLPVASDLISKDLLSEGPIPVSGSNGQLPKAIGFDEPTGD